jgi:hypothetical protein
VVISIAEKRLENKSVQSLGSQEMARVTQEDMLLGRKREGYGTF